MKKVNLFVAGLLLAAVMFVGCKDDDNGKDGKISGGSGVYVAGYLNNQGNFDPVLWKNEKAHTLRKEGSNATTNSVFVSGNDVYVAGYEFERDEVRVRASRKAILWKNGVRQVLPLDRAEAEANSVYVSGNDVYVAGYEFDPAETGSGITNTTAILWKNGERQVLSGGTNAYSVFVSGTDVYVAGGNSLWKNGTRQGLPISNANSVFVSGSDVYVAGSSSLWKNGTTQTLPGFDFANSVFVSGSDVYVAGQDCSGLCIAKLWKNGETQDLQNCYRALSVFVSDGDVYVAGTSGSAILWKNNDRQELGPGEARSVFVVK